MKGGMQQLMQQANQLQLKIKKLQAELDQREYEGSAGGEALKVKVRGENQIVSVQIQEDIFKAGDVELLQDLVMTAANEALKKAKETHSTEMQKITGGFGFPGI